MALAECSTTVDQTGREMVEHGTTEFPIACYHDDFRATDVPWHWHQEWEAVLITEGSCMVAAGNRKVTLHAGEGFFINSGILHGCWDLESTGCRFHSLVFHPRLVGGSLDSIFYHDFVRPLTEASAFKFLPLYPFEPWQKAALDALENAWQACAQELPGYPFRVRNFLSEFVYLLCSHLPSTQRSPSQKSLRDAERIKTMLSRIHAQYSSALTIRDIAASASISESECLRCFHSAIGTSPIRYLKQYRIQQAARMLLQTDAKVSEIAEQCGFQDMSYFTRAFREQMGTVPSEYRKTANP